MRARSRRRSERLEQRMCAAIARASGVDQGVIGSLPRHWKVRRRRRRLVATGGQPMQQKAGSRRVSSPPAPATPAADGDPRAAGRRRRMFTNSAATAQRDLRGLAAGRARSADRDGGGCALGRRAAAPRRVGGDVIRARTHGRRSATRTASCAHAGRPRHRGGSAFGAGGTSPRTAYVRQAFCAADGWPALGAARPITGSRALADAGIRIALPRAADRSTGLLILKPRGADLSMAGPSCRGRGLRRSARSGSRRDPSRASAGGRRITRHGASFMARLVQRSRPATPTRPRTCSSSFCNSARRRAAGSPSAVQGGLGQGRRSRPLAAGAARRPPRPTPTPIETARYRALPAPCSAPSSRAVCPARPGARHRDAGSARARIRRGNRRQQAGIRFGGAESARRSSAASEAAAPSDTILRSQQIDPRRRDPALRGSSRRPVAAPDGPTRRDHHVGASLRRAAARRREAPSARWAARSRAVARAASASTPTRWPDRRARIRQLNVHGACRGTAPALPRSASRARRPRPRSAARRDLVSAR